MQTNTKAFTLVEMLVAMAVSTIIIAATYASYDLVATQYKKNIDVAEMHTSGRAIMQMIERDVRMAGFEYRDQDANVTYGPITAPLVIKDSGDKCCDEVTVIYDYYDEDNKKVERIRIRYWAESYSSNKGNRYRLYKQIDVLGRNNAILANPIIGSKDLLADFVEDLQLFNIQVNSCTYTGGARPKLGINVQCHPEGYHISVSGLKGRVDGLAFDPKGFLFAGSSFGGGIYKINIATGAQTKLQSSIDKVTALAFNKKTQKLYVGSGRSNINIIDPDSGNNEGQINLPIRTRGGVYVPGASALAFNNNGLLYIGHKSHYSYVIVDPISKKAVGDCESSSLPQGAYSIAADSKGYLYAGGSYGNGLNAFKGCSLITDRKILATLKHHKAGPSTVFAATIGNVLSGNEALVTINLTLRTRNQYGKDRQFKKKDYHSGNFKFDKNDKYKRDTFSSKVLVRNLML